MSGFRRQSTIYQGAEILEEKGMARSIRLMDASTTVGIAGAIATIGAVVIAHWLSQKAGERRADQVRDEVLNRIDAVATRLSEVNTSLGNRISEVKTDLNGKLSELKADSSLQTGQLRLEIENSSKGLRDLLTSELRAVKAEIIAALPERTRSASEHQR